MRETFRFLTDFDPYDFQLKPVVNLLHGNNVILRAPTGAGKTWTALLPFVYSKQNGQPFADKMLYVLPLRTLTKSLYETIKNTIDKLNLSLTVTIQMGNQPEDPFFKGDIIFTTIDQLLSNYIGISLSASRRTSNVPPGAFIGSYIVIDEFHLLSPTESLTTLIDMVNRFKFLSRFLLMTATVPDNVSQLLINRLSATEVIVKAEEVKFIPNIFQKKRTIQYKAEMLAPETIVQSHLKQNGYRKTMAIFNTVNRAQQTYKDVKQLLEGYKCNDKIILLHSRFLPSDREVKELDVVTFLSKQSDENCLVIATQVVEVGLDISVKELLTEMCPANALLQRAGRCARYAYEEGNVTVYDVPKTEKGVIQASPYVDSKDKPMKGFLATMEYLHELPKINCTIDNELHIVNRALKDEEIEKIESINPYNRKKQVEESLSTGENHYLRELVRDVDSISLIIHPNPRALDMRLYPERFSISYSVLENFVRALLKTENPGIYGYFVSEDDEPMWIEISTIGQLRSQVLICIHPQHASYDKEIGLIFQENIQGLFCSTHTRAEVETIRAYSYHKETYEEHIKNVRREFQQQEQYQLSTERIAAYYSVSPSSFLKWVEMVISLHDLAKLSIEHVMKYRLWQQEIIKEPADREFLAHTDYNDALPRHKEMRKKKRYKPGPHAAESAMLAKQILINRISVEINDKQKVDEIVSAFISAIARHHSARTKKLDKCLQIHKDAYPVIAKTLKGLGLNVLKQEWMKPNPEVSLKFENELVLPNESESMPWLVYWYTVRRLRLADWAALEKGGELE